MARNVSKARANGKREEDATSASTSNSLGAGDGIGLPSPIKAGAVTNPSSSGGKEEKGIAPARQLQLERRIERNVREILDILSRRIPLGGNVEVKGEYNLKPKEMLRRCGLSQYEAETTRIESIELSPDNIKVVTQRTVKHQPKK